MKLLGSLVALSPGLLANPQIALSDNDMNFQGEDSIKIEEFIGGEDIRGLGRFANPYHVYNSQCGNPSAPHNNNLFMNLPDRTIIDMDVPGYDAGMDRYIPDTNDKIGDGDFRIVGGKEANAHSWPWQVRVRPCSNWRCTYLCGGSLVAPQWVVTAAHCIPYGASGGNITTGAQLLFDDYSGVNANAANYSILSIHAHKEWNRYKRINDIAMIKTKNAMAYNDDVKPICLPGQDICFNPGTACVVTGWGYTQETGPISNELQEVAVRIIDFNTCKGANWYTGMVYESQVCAGYVDGQQDSCAGDSGGPLVCRLGDDMPWVLYGVVSWGWGCARSRKPGVYTKVSAFHDWMDTIMGGGEGTLVNGANYPCSTCKDHNPGECAQNINPWFATEGPLNTPETPATTEPAPTTPEPTTTQAPTTTTTTTTTTPKPTTTRAPTTTTNSKGYSCGGDFSGEEGWLTTPNFPEYYRKDQTCTWNYTPKDNEFVVLNVKSNDLDNVKNCWKTGDYLTIKCGAKRQFFCSGQTSARLGVVACNEPVEVFFKADTYRINKGSQIGYKVMKDTNVNQCGFIQDYNKDSKNVMGLDNVDIYPMTHLKNKQCNWNFEVETGKRAQLEFSRWRNWITAREQYNRKIRKWRVVKCYDYIDLFEEDGMTLIAKVCGRRAFRYEWKWTSKTNKMIAVLHTDGNPFRKERVWFKLNAVN